MKRIIRVRPGPSDDRSYRIIVEQGQIRSLPSPIAKMAKGGKAFVITDDHVYRLYGRRILRDLHEAGVQAVLLDFPAGEESKNVRTVTALHTQLLNQGVRRNSLIVALGGGVVGDVAGFVAATILRGVRFIQVPTSLLAQVDSSVGGKVGIDHPLGKNLIGAFHQPAAVFIDPELLQTLPAGEFRNGLAELVKIAAALDGDLFRMIERRAGAISQKNVRVMSELIGEAVALKAAVVARDERDSGLRKTLNLGHTIGHALEAASAFTLPHGKAVAMGLAAEGHIALNMGLLEQRDLTRLLKLLRALGLPVRLPKLKDSRAFFAALDADKKGDGDFTPFVLLKQIGHSIIGVEVPTPFITSVLQ